VIDMSLQVTHIKSTGQYKSKADLAVLIPFYQDNPANLLESLFEQMGQNNNVQIWVYDDGTQNKALSAELSALIKSAKSRANLLTASENRGRSFARNYLVDQTGSDWVLFLDADMLPVQSSFLDDYLKLIESQNTDIVFGGFSVPNHVTDKDRELHRVFSKVSDALDVKARERYGAQYVCSSNLCVRKSVLKDEPFDPGFKGWGWEDSEWAARVVKKYNLCHADIPALHLGLETTDTLLRRFRDSGENYRRFTNKHPELAKSLTLYKAIHKLKRLPGHELLRPLLKLCVKLNHAPMKLRLISLKLWRASWYADVFS